MSKIRVAVVRGGPSDEYEVSLRTGEQVLKSLDRALYQPLDIVVTKGTEWLEQGRVRQPQEVLQGVDVVFNALHGTYGEDGTIQRIFERYGVPYTGSNSYTSAIAMNKAMTKDHLRHLNIHLPRHFIVGESARDNTLGMARSINALFSTRYIVKPLASGSSCGVARADNEHELAAVLSKILADFPQALVEEYIEGREATCGVIEGYRNSALYALPPIEIIPQNSTKLFDYTAKYDGTTDERCPSSFSTKEKNEIERIAKLAHTTLGLSQYSRSDFIVNSHGVYFLEVNTLPGLTETSLFPKALTAVGGQYGDFIHHLLTTAHARRVIAM